MSKFVDQKRRSFFRKRQKIHPLPSIIGSVRNSDHAKGAGGVFLHYEIFLDLLFAENLLLNYTILRLSSFLLKRSATRRRSFAAAALGAGYAVLYAVFARYLPGALLALVGIGITTGMVKSGCRITTVRDLVVGMAGYILSGFLIGSAYRLFRELMPGRGIFLFLLSGSAAYAGTLLLLKIRKEMLLEHARQVTVQLVQNGKWKKVKGLYDTGNTLRDATTKKPVSVVPYTVILELFPDKMRTGIAALARHETVPEPEQLLALQPRYIPFRGLEGRGFLPVIRISEMILVTEHTARHISGPLIALGGENSSSPRGYEIILHPDLMEGQEEADAIAGLSDPENETARSELIEHNLRLVVYIAQKFDNTGVGVEDLISIGTIGLIKAINTFNPEKKIKLATYASRCIENEILMYLRRNNKTRMEVSIDEPLNVDWDGNELLLSDILGTEEDVIYQGLEQEAEHRVLGSAISKLSEREQVIVKLRFGINMPEGREKTQKEVADLLGISQSYISRLEKRIMKRLRKEIARYE